MEPKKRNPIIAVFLSFLVTGLGQMYNGHLKKGIILCFTKSILIAVLFISPLMYSFPGFVLSMVALLLLTVYIIGDAIYYSIKQQAIELKKYNKVHFYVLYIIIALAFSICSDALIKNKMSNINTYIVSSPSMLPTLGTGDRIICFNNYFNIHTLNRGDIIVFNNPILQDANTIGRVVAIGGDIIEFKDNELYVNGEKAIEKYVNREGAQIIDMEPTQIPSGSMFVLADNRKIGFDSREYGPISADRLVGKVMYIWWSTDQERIGGV